MVDLINKTVHEIIRLEKTLILKLNNKKDIRIPRDEVEPDFYLRFGGGEDIQIAYPEIFEPGDRYRKCLAIFYKNKRVYPR